MSSIINVSVKEMEDFLPVLVLDSVVGQECCNQSQSSICRRVAGEKPLADVAEEIIPQMTGIIFKSAPRQID